MQSLTHNFASKIKLDPFNGWLKIVSLVVLLVLCFGSKAQNLVLNPDFESYTVCPDAGGQISFATPWIGAGSVEYNNSCANTISPDYGVPGYSARYQYAHSGEGYAALLCFYNGGREYLHSKLSDTMILGKSYHLSFYVNLANFSKYSLNNLALSLTDTTISNPNEEVISLLPNIYLFGKPLIKDTMSWQKIEGLYLSNGTESFITIGNFYDDNNTILEIVNPTGVNAAYYFIDDVSVKEITQPFWQYHDTIVYYGDSVLIGPAFTGLDIDWYTDNLDFISNAPGIYVTPPTSRDYIAKETFDGVETEHVVHVTVIGGAGLDENELQNVRVFPNPSKGSFSISGITSEKPLQLEVRDVHGKLVFEEKAFSKELNSFALDVENGIYFVTVSDLESKGFVVEKLVVSR
jgi:hypothetical protein